MAIPSTASLSSPSLRRPLKSRYPTPVRLRSIFEQARMSPIPTGTTLAHHFWKEPQCSTCTRGYAEDDLEEAIINAIPNGDALPPLPVRRTGHASMPMSNAFVALLLSETNIGTITSQRAFRSTPLEPTSRSSIPKAESLAPLVFSANQTSHDTH